MNLATIRSNLKGIMQNLVTSTTVAVVYDYYESNPTGYPAIVFDITDNSDSFLTTSENLMVVTFTAYVLVEVLNKNVEQATDILDTVTDALIDIVSDKDNITLSGEADWISPTVGPRNQIETPNGQAFMQELSIKVNTSRVV